MGNCISISLQFDAIFSNCYQSTVAQASFVHKLKENLKALEKALEELTDVKNELVRRVKIAEEEDQLTCHDGVRIMGLYGMGGVGKTTLLRKINNNFLNSEYDYHVIWVVVSKDHTIENIQNSIGEKIRLSCEEATWKSKTRQQKSQDIFNVLNKKKFVLLLDDIWERIDLVKIGIPFPNEQNGSKLVFTTRSKDVCSRMSTDKQVEVKCLSWKNSWKLFQEMVGKEALNVHLDILDLAKQVAKECGGLPLALTTIGRAMACKRTCQEWRHAIQILKSSASEFSSMGDEVLPLLKFSYDNLSSKKVRSCFLYCALFPEDWEINRDSLIYYWMCEGFLDECNDLFDEKLHSKSLRKSNMP